MRCLQMVSKMPWLLHSRPAGCGVYCRRTPHLLLRLDVGIRDAQRNRLVLGVLLDSHEFGNVEVQGA